MTKPFLKWAGGKTQLLNTIDAALPAGIGTTITKYAEPFVGGGAVLFYLLDKYNITEAYISDVNFELINAYTIIKEQLDELLVMLEKIQEEYCSLSAEHRKEYYYNMRSSFNKLKIKREYSVEKAAYFIALNKTCFNGLYRVNGKGEFNVPSGTYKNPKIYDPENLKEVSKLLQRVTIECANYNESKSFIDANTFVYFDPPYRPLSKTSSFTSYTNIPFNDDEQIELAQYTKQLSDIGAKVMISNSDPKNTDKNDNFFDDLYEEFNIKRISASRMINRDGESRGKISELLITNY